MSLSDYDRRHIGSLVAGEGTWFTAKLLRLMAEADDEHRARIALGFPEEVAAYEAWRRGDAAVLAFDTDCGEAWCSLIDPAIDNTVFECAHEAECHAAHGAGRVAL